jgi:glyoxylase-like metal-dependent hydrolase (beta-lactamase superfamily II)
MSRWRWLGEGVAVFDCSCKVYALDGGQGRWLLINAGSGSVADHLDELGPMREWAVLLTHHFRDHAGGAMRLKARGARLLAPFGERGHLAGRQEAMRDAQHFFLYELTWDHFAPGAPLEVDGWVRDYERVELAGFTVEVVPAPGPTLGAAAYVISGPGLPRTGFTGELIQAGGKVARLSPFQYNYNDLTGLTNVVRSAERLLAAAPERVLPSFGEPISDYAAALAAFRGTIAGFEQLQPGVVASALSPAPSGIEPVLPRLYRAQGSSAETHFLVGRSGRILALDYGYDTVGVAFPARLAWWTRRPLLHSLAALKAAVGSDRIATVIATHYHDDHVVGVPTLQRQQGTELWAGENFADLLENPGAYDRPCLWPEPMRVNRRLPLGTPFMWDDVRITLHPMTGHTEFSTLILLEYEGHRVAHTGDQIFYLDPVSRRLVPPGPAAGVFTNHVYRNGLALGGYRDCVRRLREFQPDVILSGHAVPYRPDAQTWEKLEATAVAFDSLHEAVLPLAPDDVHFGADSCAAKLLPSRLQLTPADHEATLRGWILNPLPHPATAELCLSLPRLGWTGRPWSVAMEPRARTPFQTVFVPPASLRQRELITLDLVVEGREFGGVAEAWIEIR